MIRITKMSGKFYGIELPDDPQDAMNEIEEFVSQGEPVIIVASVEDLSMHLDIDDDVIMVERTDG